MCRTKDEIMQNDPLVQELQDYIDANHLPATEKLLLRMAKHSYIQGIQIKEDITEITRHNKLCKDNPSLQLRFKRKPWKVIGEVFGVGLGIYLVLEILNHTLGFEALIKMVLP